ncbi:uncharacterized protein LOC129792997 [Lutzomyia longipalpis]|nr:uncharacterized protein LOC129792997 [Lutzomyia longipalpis]
MLGRLLRSPFVRLCRNSPLIVSSGRNFCSKIETATSKHDRTGAAYIGSNAGKWMAEQTRSGPSRQGVWYQPYVVMACLVTFMAYFCILREENDIDLELQKSLYERIEGLEETQLRVRHKYNLENGLDVKDIEDRLKELGASVEKTP